MGLRFDNRVAIVTGAGTGLGRSHALALAARGAKVLVNDFGGDVHGEGGSSAPAERVADEIRKAGGQALSHGADVSNPAQVADMVANAMGEWGRIVMTTSTSGIYGNFGQANYGAAKAGLIGLMNALQIEGEKYGIRVNVLCPSAATRMTEGLMPPALLALMSPGSVTPVAVFLASEEAPRRTILSAVAGGYSRIVIEETRGVYLPEGERTPEAIAARFGEIADREGALYSELPGGPGLRFVEMAAAEAGMPVPKLPG